jgi:ABC-2 type transport system ATP-binding protein
VAIVETRGLTKSYGGRPPALRDVTLSLEGGVTGLLGPNGAGKSTFLQCVLGLLPDYQGSVSVLGMDARRERREVRRRVGFMPETDTYLPEMTGIRAVRFLGQLTGMPYREALRRAHEVLFHVGLGEAVYRAVTEYSTGMRQRFKLAQAIVHDPEIVFLDEPLSGLDPAGRDDLLALIRDLARVHGKHVVWSSHILPEVQKVADSVVVLHQGRCRGTFRLEDMKPRQGTFAVEVEGGATRWRELLVASAVHVEPAGENGEAAAETAAHAMLPVSSRSQWTVRLPDGMGSDALLAAARDAGVRLRRLQPRGQTLEEVFLDLLETGEATP